MPDKITNTAASVRQRLKNLSDKEGWDYQIVMRRYVLERILYRLKDFHDVAVIASMFAFEGPSLVKALAATFTRRGTPDTFRRTTRLHSALVLELDGNCFFYGPETVTTTATA